MTSAPTPRPAAQPAAEPAEVPLQSPMPRSPALDREEPEFNNEADLPEEGADEPTDGAGADGG